MRARVGHYRRAPIGPGEDPFIGCVFVRDITFFGSNELAEPPPAFAPNIVQGKSYDMLAERVHSYFEELLSRLLAPPLVLADDGATWHRPGPAYGDPRLQRQRLGQRAFQAVVLDAYSRKCAR
jgi:putative restriction endonuclease